MEYMETPMKITIIMKVKITINSEDRIIMIPMEYNTENDTLEFNDIQIEPMPEKNENISKDIVFNMAQLILSTLKSL
jgi:hypothetical protein